MDISTNYWWMEGNESINIIKFINSMLNCQYTVQSTPSTYTYRDPRHVGVISNGTSCCFGVEGFGQPWLTFKWEEANGPEHEDCQTVS